MTPALQLLIQAGVTHHVHPYQHDAASTDYGTEAAQKLGVNPQLMFKTLVVCSNLGQLALCLVSVQDKIALKRLAQAMNCKKADLADPGVAEKTTGYILGGISPLGGRKKLPVLLDQSITNWGTIFISAGKRGLQVELSPHDLILLTQGQLVDVSER